MSKNYIKIIGEPVGKARPRFTRSGRVYTPKATKDYEKKVAQAWKINGYGKTDKAVSVEIAVYCSRPKSAKRRFPTVKPDVDNIAKIILDGLNGVAYEDDKQVVSLSIDKVYAIDYPFIEIEVKEIGVKNVGS